MNATLVCRILAVGLLGGIGVQGYAVARRSPDVTRYQEQIRAAAERVPIRIGGWVGQDAAVPVQALTVLKPNVMLSRRYVNVEDGTVATVMSLNCWSVNRCSKVMLSPRLNLFALARRARTASSPSLRPMSLTSRFMEVPQSGSQRRVGRCRRGCDNRSRPRDLARHRGQLCRRRGRRASLLRCGLGSDWRLRSNGQRNRPPTKRARSPGAPRACGGGHGLDRPHRLRQLRAIDGARFGG